MSVDRRPPPVHPSRRPLVLHGLSKLLGLSGGAADIKPQVQMAALLARTKREDQVYAGTVPDVEVQRRRAKNRRARASRRINRGRR